MENEIKDFLIDSHYDLYASDFLSDSEISELSAPRDVTDEDMKFWNDLLNRR